MVEYGVVLTFSVKTELLPAIQQIVKDHGMRFVNNPAALVYPGCRYVSVEVGSSDVESFKAGSAAINNIIDPPLPVVTRAWWSCLFDWCYCPKPMSAEYQYYALLWQNIERG